MIVRSTLKRYDLKGKMDLEEKTALELESCQRKGTFARAGTDKNGKNAWYCTYNNPDRITNYCINQGSQVMVHRMIKEGLYIKEIHYKCLR